MSLLRPILGVALAAGLTAACSGGGDPSQTPSGSEPTDPPVTATQPAATQTQPGQGTQTPTAQPTLPPGETPTAQPTLPPGETPTAQPTLPPGETPTAQPTLPPGETPTAQPTLPPGETPTAQPTLPPGETPTAQPTLPPGETPTAQPTLPPGETPTAQPTLPPGETPTAQPTLPPGETPTAQPTLPPGETPTAGPQGCVPIHWLQDPSLGEMPAEDEVVQLCGVIVTALDVDGFFVGDPSGGAYSGIYVFVPEASTAVPDDLALGDEVDIVGRYGTFLTFHQIGLYFSDDFQSTVTITSRDNDLPPATTIRQPATIASQCSAENQHGPNAEQYEAVRLRVLTTSVQDIDPCDLGRFGVFEIEGNLLVDDDAGMTYNPSPNQSLASVSGVLHYRFDFYRLFPGPGDVVAIGGTPTPDVTPEPTPEPTPGPTAAPTEPPDELTCSSVQSLQNPNAAGHPDLNTVVKLCDVIVTQTNASGYFFVQEAGGGPYSGIYVFHQSAFEDPTVVSGDEVTIVGSFEEYQGVLEIVLRDGLSPAADIETTNVGVALPDAMMIDDPSSVATDCDTLVSGSLARSYAGVRIQVSNISIQDMDPCGLGDFGVFAVDGGLLVDDFMDSTYEPQPNETFIWIRGVLHYSFDTYRILPGPGDVFVD